MIAQLTKACEFLLNDAPVATHKLHKLAYPAINHKLTVEYAAFLDSALVFEDSKAKSLALVYHKLISCTLKHCLHKHNRDPAGTSQFKVWAVIDFYTNKQKLVRYVEYPRIDDLCALKRECNYRTAIKKIKSEKIDEHLDNLTYCALVDHEEYTAREFKADFKVINEFWEEVLFFMRSRQ